MKGGEIMASITKRYGKWQARYTWYDEDGKKHQKAKNGFPTKAAARKYAAKLEMQVANGIAIQQDPTFADYYDNWFETYKKNSVSDNTIRHYVLVGKLIREFFHQQKLKKITRSRYQQFINWYGQDHAPETVKKVRAISSACVRSASLDGIISKNFAERSTLVADNSRKMKVEYLSLSEISSLIKVLEDGRQPRYTARYMVLTAIYTGARLGEIAALTWNDIDFLHRTISINKAWDYLHGGGFKSTKNKSSVRVIALNKKLLTLLKELRSNDSSLIFMNPYHQIPSSNGVNKVLRNALKRAGLSKRDFHFHSLRHSHVAYLLSQGIDLYTISKRLGHSSMMTTGKIYAYLIDEYQQKQNDDIREKLQNL